VSPDQREQKHVDVLLASYKSKKDEISRRSTLQQAGSAAYLAVLAGTFQSVLGETKPKGGILVIVTWWVAILAYLFSVSQQREILRLSGDITHSIEQKLKGFAGQDLLEAWYPYGGHQWFFDRGYLMRIVYFVLPLLLTIWEAEQLWQIVALRTFWWWIFVGSASAPVVLMGYLLYKLPIPQP
jgi:hypothetical protein